jgi:hypothetical protein
MGANMHVTTISSTVLKTALVDCPEMRNATAVTTVFIRQRCPGKLLEEGIEKLSEVATWSFANISGVCVSRDLYQNELFGANVNIDMFRIETRSRT